MYVVRVAGEMGPTDFGKLSIDGTAVRANASERKSMSLDRMKREEARLRAEFRALSARAGEVDAEEDARRGGPEAKAQSNFTDPESGIMKTSSEGLQQCTNAQVAVCGKNQMIVATVVGRGGVCRRE